MDSFELEYVQTFPHLYLSMLYSMLLLRNIPQIICSLKTEAKKILYLKKIWPDLYILGNGGPLMLQKAGGCNFKLF